MKNQLRISHNQSWVRQRGASLIVVLMLLVIVSLLGVASMQISMMSERAARSDRDMQLAWQGAEAALVDAEIELQGPNNYANSRTAKILASGPSVGTGCNTTRQNAGWLGFCGINSGITYTQGALQDVTIPTWLTVDFTDTSTGAPSVALGTYTGRIFENANIGGGKGIQPALAPRYIIEVIPPNADAGNPSDIMTTANAHSKGGGDDTNAASGALYRVTSMGFGPRSDIQAVLQTIYRN